jgi:hypothetical protein
MVFRAEIQRLCSHLRMACHLHPNMMRAPGRATLESDPDDAQERLAGTDDGPLGFQGDRDQ